MHCWLKEVPVDAENIAAAFPAIVHRLPTIHTEHVSFGASPLKPSAPRPVRTLDQPRSLPPANLGNVYYIKGNEQLFIYWRVLQGGQVLELQLHSLSQSQLAKESTETSRFRKPIVANQRERPVNVLQRSKTDLMRPVQFVFPSTILPTVCFHDVAYGRETVQITLLLASGVLYQLSLAVPDVFTPGHKFPHDFARHKVVEAVANPNSGNIPVFLHSVNPHTSLIACKNGSIISVCKRTADDYDEKEITSKDFLAQVKNSGITRFFSTAINAIGSPLKTESLEPESALSQSVAIASCTFRETSIAFSLCRDRKLRIYDVNQGICMKTIPVNSSVIPSCSEPISQQSTDTEEQQPLPASPKSYLRVIPCERPNGASLNVMIYVRSDPDPFFALVQCAMSASGSIKNAYMVHRISCDRFSEAGASVGEELVDFQVVKQSAQRDELFSKGVGHDSALKPHRLWTLWDRQGQTAMRYSEINIPTDLDNNSVYISASERWHSVVMKKKEFIDTAYFQAELLLRPHVSIADIFLGYIFQPGRFSTHALEQGIAKYEATISESHNPFHSRNGGQTGGARRKETRSELKDHATRLVAKHIKIETYPQTGAPLVDEHRNQVLNEWRRFTTMCLQAQQYCDKLLGLSISSATGMVSIAKQSAYSTVRMCDQAEVIYHHSIDDFPLGELSLISDRSILEIYPEIAHMFLNKDIFHILRAGEYLREQMSMEVQVSVDEELQSAVTAPLSMAMESFADEFYDKQIRSSLGAQKRSRLFNILHACDDPRQTFLYLIQMLQFPYSGGLDGQDSAPEGNPQFAMQSIIPTKSTTIFADALMTTSIQQTAYARHDIARTLFLLLVAISSAPESKRHIPDAPYVLSKCLKVFHSAMLLSWMTKQSLRSDEMAARTVKPGQGLSDALLQDDGFIHLFADMHLLPNFIGTPFQQPDIPPAAINFISYSLVHVLLHKHYHVSLTNEQSHVSRETENYALPLEPQFILQHGIRSFMQKLGIFEPVNSTVCTGAAHITLAIMLDACGVPQSLLKEYLKFLDKLPAVEYLHGKQSLRSGELDKARQSFQRAGAGLVTRQSAIESDRLFSCVLRRDVLLQGLCGYYKNVADLFEASGSHGNVVAMCRLALNSVPLTENQQKYAELVRVLHHKLFISSLELGNYEEAFMAIMGNPDPETKRDNIRHFVTLLCEHDQVRRLCSQFTFVGLDDEVEQTLMFKARNGDVLVAPNYYKILYSWHVYRGDYRNACMVMYQHGRRLGAVTAGNVSFLEIATEQARSYLAAMNALKLVDKAYAWIFMPKEGGAGGEDPARKRLKILPREQRDLPFLSNNAHAPPVSKDVDIIQLEDIQKDYLLALAKLNLADRYEELGQMAGAIDAADAVTLYTQADRFDDAFSLAAAHGLSFQPIFDRLITRCLSLEQTTPLHWPADDDFLAVDDDTDVWDGTPVDHAWRLVRKYLEMHDDEKAQYREGVLDKMLSLDRNARLWPWLTHFYKEHHSDDLIRICVKYERVIDAAQFALEQIQRATNIKTVSAPRWLPYSLIDQLLCALQELQDNPLTPDEEYEDEENRELATEQRRVDSLMQQLQLELDRYFDRVRAETRTMREQVVASSGQGGFAEVETMMMV